MSLDSFFGTCSRAQTFSFIMYSITYSLSACKLLSLYPCIICRQDVHGTYFKNSSGHPPLVCSLSTIDTTLACMIPNYNTHPPPPQINRIRHNRSPSGTPVSFTCLLSSIHVHTISTDSFFLLYKLDLWFLTSHFLRKQKL